MAFNPTEHFIKIGKKDYLPVPFRIVWFRDVYKKGIIDTDYHGISEGIMILRTHIYDEERNLLATGMATVRSDNKANWSGREIEKAETAAIGRALAHAGFGTQFTGDDEGEYLADSPVQNTKSSQWNEKVTELTTPLYNHVSHQKNSLNKALTEGVINNKMTPLQATAVMLQRKLEVMYGVDDADVFNMLNKPLLEALDNTPIEDILAEAKLTFIPEEVK